MGSGSGSGSGWAWAGSGSGSGSGFGSGSGSGGGFGSGSGSGGGGGHEFGWIKGRFFHDSNHDGTEHDGKGGHESGIAGARIELVDLHGNVVQVAHTNHEGVYQFDVPDGVYQVRFPVQNGKVFTHKDVGNDAKDSDANAHGLTDPIHIWPGKTMKDVDAGVNDVRPGWVKGRIFDDLDCDGQEEAGEPGFANVWVALVNTATGKIAAWTKTDAHGKYQFDVAAGEHKVLVRVDNLVDDYTLTTANVGPEATDSDGVELYDHGLKSNGNRVAEVCTTTLHVNPGQTVKDIDVGLKEIDQPGSISGTVFHDLDCDGLDGSSTITHRDVVIAEDNFQGGADAGWSDRWVMNARNGDKYLGGFGKTNSSVDTEKSFDLPHGTKSVMIEFDFLEVDSWDKENFYVFIEGQRVDLGKFAIVSH